MFDNLSERLERSFKILKGEGKITEINVAETLKDVRKALLDADVNYKVAKGFTDTVAPTPYPQQSNNTKETKGNNNAEAANNKENTTHTPYSDNKKKETSLHILQP